MRFTLRLKFSWLVVTLLCAQAWMGWAWADDACKKIIATGNPEYPPFLWRDPQDETRLVGANAEYMQAISREIGIPVEVRYIGSWARVQEEARQGRIDMIAGAFFTLPRLEYMDYFYPAIRETHSLIWVKKNSRLSYQRWNDLIGKSGVTVINNSFGDAFDRFAKQSLKIATVPSLEQAFNMLGLSRVDYLIYEEDPGYAAAEKLNIRDIKTLSPPITNENLHLTIAHKSTCNTPSLRGRISKAIYKLEKQNLLEKLIASNSQLWRLQQSKTP